MFAPTTYQRKIIADHGFDPDTWWPFIWHEDSALIKNRATGEVLQLSNIVGFPDDSVCRNIANDEDDDMHDYRPQVN